MNGFGFKNSTTKFEASVFKNNKIIEQLRPVIKKYFSPAKTVYKGSSSYGLKHIAEQHLDNYVSNGEFIYAMHLEGYNIERDDPNCYFNIKKGDINSLSSSKEILDILADTKNDFTEYLKYEQSFLKYKYHFNYLLKRKFSDNRSLRRNDAITVVAKEINEDKKIINHWFNLIKEVDSVIPPDKLQAICKIFSLTEEEIFNTVSKLEKNKHRNTYDKITEQEIVQLLIDLQTYIKDNFEFRKNRFLSVLYLPYIEYKDKQEDNDDSNPIFNKWNSYSWERFKSNIWYQIAKQFDLSKKKEDEILEKIKIIVELIIEEAKEYFPSDNYMELAKLPVKIIKGTPLHLENRRKSKLQIGDLCYIASKTKNEYFVQGAVVEEIQDNSILIFTIGGIANRGNLSFSTNSLYADEIGETPEHAVENKF